MESIEKKAKKAMKSRALKERVDEAAEKIIGAPKGGAVVSGKRQAAEKFIEVLQQEIINCSAGGGNSIENGGLGVTAVSSLLGLSYGAPVKISATKYKIPIWFTEDLRRDSLDPSTYGGVENIAALLNSGYSASHVVYGVWPGHGEDVRASLPNRDGAHFIEAAIHRYKTEYADKYGVIDIEVDDIYM